MLTFDWKEASHGESIDKKTWNNSDSVQLTLKYC